MKTKQEYLNGSVSFREFYSQFITPELIKGVLWGIGKESILASKDEHFNDIPLRKWDGLSGCVFKGSELVSKPKIPKSLGDMFREAGQNGVSPSDLVCIYKEIAHQIKEGKIN
jgi:hypothetical protein